MKHPLPYLIFLSTIIILSCAVQFDIELTSQQRFCFYEVFELQQKYSFSAQTLLPTNFEVEVSHIDSKQWKSVFFKTTTEGQHQIRVNKLASSSTTYSFCVRNLAKENNTFQILFNTGIDMLELHNLPDAADGDNLERELTWLEKQIQALSERSQNLEGLRRINSQISNMVGTKMVILAIIGLVVIGGVNFFFFRLLKNQLKKRKLI